MSDLIDRQAAIDALMELIEARHEWISDASREINGLNAAYCAIEDLPSVQPQRTRGKWIPIQRGFFNKEVTQVKCDQCGNLLDLIGVNCGRGDANFCPNCGAWMGGHDE